MGRLYTPGDIEGGRVPRGDGSDHYKAAEVLLDGVRAVDTPEQPMSGMAFGSLVTGNAGRRSDLDFLLRYSSLDQLRDLQIITRSVQDNLRVAVEAQTFQDGAFRTPASHDVSPLFASHLLHVQDEFPQWVHGLPVEELREFAIDTRDRDGVESDDEAREVLIDVISYLHYKMRQFAKTALMAHQRKINYYTTQRALELPKALGRKALAVHRLLGTDGPSADVTDRNAMRNSFYGLIEAIDDDGTVEHYHFLDGLDADYDRALEEAVSSMDTEEYTRWLGENWLKACHAAHLLCEGFGEAMEKVADDTGVDLNGNTAQGTRA